MLPPSGPPAAALRRPDEPPISGVFAANPFNQPTPPPGAKAVELRDRDGNTIAFAWVIREHGDDYFRESAWAYFDGRQRLSAATDVPLKIVR